MEKRNATVAVIGAGDYIGAEIARKFAAEGFTVFAGRRNGAKLEPLVKEIEAAGGKALPIVGDIRFEEQVLEAVKQTVAKFGCIDICVNNASAIVSPNSTRT